jgi:hypothetical protein
MGWVAWTDEASEVGEFEIRVLDGGVDLRLDKARAA